MLVRPGRLGMREAVSSLMPAGFVLRAVEPGDIDRVHALIACCYAEHGFRFIPTDPEESHVAEPWVWFPERGGGFWVVEAEDGAIAGTAAMYVRGEGEAELKSLYVSPGFRRRGLGGALTRLILAEAASRSCDRVVLWSDVAFTDAHRLYLAHGFDAGGVRWVEASEPYAEVAFVRGI